ncbi:MAG: glycolate oxidase subunit GlcF [Gammaproteobacteria bacterium]|nr:glycolate oxidase subunit GlcF [Gammaproteobacteria bacterium]MBL7000108.1 glycolate oxidase subunit GlcF [Gammaproteobacteria bacterium]
MQTSLTAELLKTATGQRANEILRKCVHCGFCTATCPTYQLLGDELDGPRGRIYQIKQMLEGQQADREMQLHLDRCLSCRSCETTCPSGVDYAELADIGRHYIEQKNLRPLPQKLIRKLLGYVLPRKNLNQLLFRISSRLRPLLGHSLQQKTPIIRTAREYRQPSIKAQKTVLLLEGCVQSTLSPNTNSAAAVVLQTLGYQVIRQQPVTCCGAVNHHLSQPEQTAHWVTRNLQEWLSIHQNTPLDAIVSSATGCGAMLKDYPTILRELPEQDPRFQQLLPLIRDISELFSAQTLRHNHPTYSASQQTIAFHAPCTLTHAQRLTNPLYQQLQSLGYRLHTPQNAHLCCGSAGTYSLLQPEISRQLRKNKLDALSAVAPELIITANVGCEHHLNSASPTPVIHWIELIANDLEHCD